jgi:hypothetical protein
MANVNGFSEYEHSGSSLSNDKVLEAIRRVYIVVVSVDSPVGFSKIVAVRTNVVDRVDESFESTELVPAA